MTKRKFVSFDALVRELMADDHRRLTAELIGALNEHAVMIFERVLGSLEEEVCYLRLGDYDAYYPASVDLDEDLVFICIGVADSDDYPDPLFRAPVSLSKALLEQTDISGHSYENREHFRQVKGYLRALAANLRGIADQIEERANSATYNERSRTRPLG